MDTVLSQSVNVIQKFTGTGRITSPMLGFKAFHSAAATLAGIEAAHMIRKEQFMTNGLSAFQRFARSQHNCVYSLPDNNHP